MINKISALIAAALVIGSVATASAAATHQAKRHHYTQQNSGVMLLENRPNVAPYAVNPYTQDDKQSGHLW